MGFAGSELGDVETPVGIDRHIVRMPEDVLLMGHGPQFAVVVVGRRGAGDVGDDAQRAVEHGDEAAAVADLGPVVAEVRDDVVVLDPADLAWVSTGEIDLPELDRKSVV